MKQRTEFVVFVVLVKPEINVLCFKKNKLDCGHVKQTIILTVKPVPVCY